jgi:hypothetical protein
MNHIQKESEYNQYWFYVSTPEYKLCPNSSDCKDDIDNKSPCKKMNNRMVGISTPTKLDSSKKYKYILNNDFNIDGKANDWYCGENEKNYPEWGGIISAPCASDKRYLMKNLMDLFIKFIKEDYIIIHLSLTYEDVYYNQPPCDNKLDKNCDVTVPCKKYWYPNNPDQQYLENLFNLIYKNAFPSPLNNLKLSYDDLALFGYSVGAGAVSRYINEFPLMKTKPDNYDFPLIKSAVMVAGGSLYCYSAIFSPCFDTNVSIRGCCPATLSEPNFDNGVIPWSQHPPVIIIQSSDDSYADPMAGTYYYNVMVKNNVPVKKVIDDSTIHGISSTNQINAIIDWVKENYSNTHTSNKNEINKSRSKVPQITFTIVILIIFAVLFILLIKNYKNNPTYSIIAGIFLFFAGIILIIYLFLPSNKKVTKSNNKTHKHTHKDINSLNILQQQMLLTGKPSRVTVGELFDKVVEIKNQIYTDYPDIGGVLVHLAPLEGLQDILKNPNFEFNLSSGGQSFMTDCSMVGQNKQNCSAWTYLRKDLPPMVYSYPSSPAGPAPFWTPSIGFIVDPSRLWPIINTMGIVDSATDSRNCGSQDTSYQLNIFDIKHRMGRCNPDVYNSKGVKLNSNEHCIFQSSNTSVDCKTECSYEKDIVNANCRFKNSGASLHNYSWYSNDFPGFSWDCPNPNNRYNWYDPNFPNGVTNCYKAVEIDWDDISPEDQALLNSNGYGKNNGVYKKWAKFIPSEDCYLTSPTLYQTNDTNSAGQIGNLIVGTNMEISSIDRNYYYVGEKENINNGGANFEEQTWKNCDFNTGATAENCKIDPTSDKNIPISVNNIITKQAKWLKKDWGRWIIEIKKLWKYIYSTMDETGYKNKSAIIDGNDKKTSYGYNYDYNYLYGNPCNTGDWWENEVNVYINDEMAKDENSDLNKLFRNSMIGAFYIGKTCEDFVSDLPSGTTLPNGYNQQNCKFDNGIERCVGYLCNYNVNKQNPLNTKCQTPLDKASKTTYADVKAEEKKRMEMGKEAIISFVEKFNNKYRKGLNKINGYKLMTTSNAFPSWVSLDKVFKGELKASDVFVPI